MSDKARLVVLISGNGSNLQAIMDACIAGELDAEVAAVFSNRKDAYGLIRAEKAGLPTGYFPWKPYKNIGRSRRDYDADLANVVAVYQPDLIVLAGWMWVLSGSFLGQYPMRVVNLHPALPGTFPGTNAIERAFAAFQKGEIASTGVMVHFVPDEGIDDGPVIMQQTVPIHPQDTLDSLTERMHAIEHGLLVMALADLIACL